MLKPGTLYKTIRRSDSWLTTSWTRVSIEKGELMLYLGNQTMLYRDNIKLPDVDEERLSGWLKEVQTFPIS